MNAPSGGVAGIEKFIHFIYIYKVHIPLVKLYFYCLTYYTLLSLEDHLCGQQVYIPVNL